MTESAQSTNAEFAGEKSLRHFASHVRPSFVLSTALRAILVSGSIFASLITFDEVRGLQYTPDVLTPWVMSVLLWCAAWLATPQTFTRASALLTRLRSLEHIRINGIRAGLILLFAIASFALLYRLDDIPYEMHGDQGHYALDAYNIVHGGRTMYEFRNTGREQLHSYVIAFIHTTFATPYLLSVKLSSVAAALLTLPALYWLGRTIGGRKLGFFAVAFAVAASWYVLFGRIGYRMTWIAPATTWTLAALWYGVRHDQRWCFVLAGLVLGLGWHTHVAFRLMPFSIAIALAIIVWRAERAQRWSMVLNSVILLGGAALVAMPLFSFGWRTPEVYFYRTNMFIDGDSTLSPLAVIEGLWLSLRMFLLGGDPQQANNYVWRAPVTAPVLALSFYAGLGLWIVRAVRRRDALSLWMPIGVLFGLLPSALAIYSPHELPSARRAYSAFPLVMVMAAAVPVYLIDYAQKIGRRRLTTIAVAGALALVAVNGVIELSNYFSLYPRHYDVSPHRFTAETIRAYWALGGREEDIYFVYSDAFQDFEWVAMSLERPAMFETQMLMTENLEACTIPVPDGGSLLFIVAPHEEADLNQLATCYPEHILQRLDSPYDSYQYEIVTFQALDTQSDERYRP